MWIVSFEGKIFKFKIFDIFDGRVQTKGWQFSRLAAQLKINLFKMIETAGLRVDEIVDNLGYGHSLIRCSLANA